MHHHTSGGRKPLVVENLLIRVHFMRIMVIETIEAVEIMIEMMIRMINTHMRTKMNKYVMIGIELGNKMLLH